jgi:hypothetical protein
MNGDKGCQVGGNTIRVQHDDGGTIDWSRVVSRHEW